MIVRRALLLTLEYLGALLAGLALLAGFLAWRLTHEGPIHLGFARPYVERVLNHASPNYGFVVDDVVLAWAGWEGVVDVRALGVRVRDQGGATLVKAPEISFALSGPALVRGVLAPSRLEIFRPDLFIERKEDGNFQLGPAANEPSAGGNEESITAAGGAKFFQAITESLTESPSARSGVGFLSEIVIRDANVQVDDRRGKSEWAAKHLTISFHRGEGGLFGSLAADLPGFGDHAAISGALDFPADEDRIKLSVRVSGFDVSTITKLEPGMAILRGADIDLSGSLSTSIDLDGKIGVTDFDLSGKPGTITLPGIMKENLPVGALIVEGHAIPGQDIIVLNDLRLDLQGPHFEFSGLGRGFFSGHTAEGGLPYLDARLTGGNLDWQKIDGWWPIGAAEDARHWIIENITEGLIDHIDGHMSLRVPTDSDHPAILENLTGSFDATGLAVHYLRPLPPITEGVLHATITEKDFVAEVSSGHVGAISLSGGKVAIDGLDGPDQRIAIDTLVTSPIQDALRLLDEPRLGYPAKLGIKPDSAGGSMTGSLHFDFPAEKDLGLDKVNIAVQAKLEDFSLVKALFNQDISEGLLDLDLTQDAMTLKGPLRLAGFPLDASWVENFSASEPVARKIEAQGLMSSADRAALGFDAAPYLEGPAITNLTYVENNAHEAHIDLHLNLKDSALNFDLVKWKKGAGVAGDLSAAIDMRNGKIADISDFKLHAVDLSAQGMVTMDEAGKLKEITIPSLRFGKSDLKDMKIGLAGDKVDLSINTGQFDAGPCIEESEEEEKEEGDKKSAERAPVDMRETADRSPGDQELDFPLHIKVNRLSSVRLGKGRDLKNASVELTYDGRWWDIIDAQASLPGGATLRVKYGPDKVKGHHNLAVSADDAGAALRVFGIFDSIKGGKLSITGETKDDEPLRPLRGRLNASSFRLLHTSFFARLLSVAALTGLADLLTGEGFYFEGAVAEFVKTDESVKVDFFRSAGPSIGITSKGTLDFENDRINLEGVIVPAYALNTILGRIPIVGKILGGKEGLFSPTYTMTGDLDEPTIKVDPLAALAPGFLRKLFTAPPSEARSLPLPQGGQNKD